MRKMFGGRKTGEGESESGIEKKERKYYSIRDNAQQDGTCNVMYKLENGKLKILSDEGNSNG